MTKLRDYDHNHSLDPAIVVKRNFLLKLEVNPPKCLENYELDKVTEILDSDVPLKKNWIQFQGNKL